MRKIRGFLLTVIVGVGGCATPQPGPNDTLLISPDAQRVVEAEGSVRANDPDSKVRCEVVRRTGSHLVSRYCYTTDEEQWLERNARDGLETMLNRTTCSGGLGCGGDN